MSGGRWSEPGATAAAGTRPTGIRSEAVRQSNLATILRSLHYAGSASRSELVVRTGLTRSAVGALVTDLVGRGLVDEQRASSDGSPGRPSPIASPRSAQNVVIAVSVMVDFVAVAAVGLGGGVLASVRVERRRVEQPVDAMIATLADLAKQVRRSLEPDAVIHGVGVGIAGIVRRADNRLVFAPNIGWHDEPFGDLLAEALGLDVEVSVANDGDLGALAESLRGVAAGVANVIYLSGEVGVGGGIISEGVPITGRVGFAGEVGHLPLNPDGRRCSCGAVGCWETEVGEDALLRRAGKDPSRGLAGADELIDEAASGDAAALEALAANGRWLGIGIAGLVNVFAPQVIVLGGLLHRTYPYMIDEVESAVASRALDALRKGVRIVPSELGIDSSLIGAAELAWQSVLDDPTRVAG